MNLIFRLVAVCLAGGALFGCAARHAEDTDASRARQVSIKRTRYAGTVRMVTGLEFVVLDCAGLASPSAGTVLEVVRNGQKIGHVRTDAPGRNHPSLITADVLDGAPQTGDYVQLEGADKPPANSGTGSSPQQQPPPARQNFRSR